MIKGRMVFIGSPKAIKKGLGPIIKDSLQEAGALWHRRYLPMHFHAGAGSRYKFKPRTRPYLRRKAKMFGHRRPLEFSGDLKREVTRKAVLSGTKKRVRVVMDTGSAWYATRNFRSRPTMPDMPSELTATTRGEVKKLARAAELYCERKINAVKTRETRA